MEVSDRGRLPYEGGGKKNERPRQKPSGKKKKKTAMTDLYQKGGKTSVPEQKTGGGGRGISQAPRGADSLRREGKAWAKKERGLSLMGRREGGKLPGKRGIRFRQWEKDLFTGENHIRISRERQSVLKTFTTSKHPDGKKTLYGPRTGKEKVLSTKRIEHPTRARGGISLTKRKTRYTIRGGAGGEGIRRGPKKDLHNPLSQCADEKVSGDREKGARPRWRKTEC